jgi:hypothetical protein
MAGLKQHRKRHIVFDRTAAIQRHQVGTFVIPVNAERQKFSIPPLHSYLLQHAWNEHMSPLTRINGSTGAFLVVEDGRDKAHAGHTVARRGSPLRYSPRIPNFANGHNGSPGGVDTFFAVGMELPSGRPWYMKCVGLRTSKKHQFEDWPDDAAP